MASLAAERLRKSVFVFLLIRPFLDGTYDLTADMVNGGVDINAKIVARNESMRQPCVTSRGQQHAAAVARWRLLMGFYTNKKNWTRKIKPKWSSMRQWETAVLQGLQFSKLYSVNSVLYVSSEARSHPESPLLKTLQHLSSKRDKSKALPLWRIVLSGKTHEEKLRAVAMLSLEDQNQESQVTRSKSEGGPSTLSGE